MSYTSWKCGNILRGFTFFKARNVKEAWKIGCKRINISYPSMGKAGRTIELYEEVVISILRSETYPKEQEIEYRLRVHGHSKEGLYKEEGVQDD